MLDCDWDCLSQCEYLLRTVDLDMVLITVLLTLTLWEAKTDDCVKVCSKYEKKSALTNGICLEFCPGVFFYLIPKFDPVGIFDNSLVYLSFFGWNLL